MPIVPVHDDPAAADTKQQMQEKQRALARLEQWAAEKIIPTRHLIFVPGWAGETGDCLTGYPTQLPKHEPPKAWLARIVPAPLGDRFIHFLSFTQQESSQCSSFRDFAPLLVSKIRQCVPFGDSIDLVGHSMGSLDAIAAIVRDVHPLRRVENLIAVGSPLQGIFYSKFVQCVDKLTPQYNWSLHHYRQVRNLEETSSPIQWANALATRQRLLDRVRAVWTLAGTQDMVVMRSARFLLDGLTASQRKQVTHQDIGGATHTGAAGVTHDPRTVRAICAIMAA